VLSQEGRGAEAIAAAERVLAIVGTEATPHNIPMLDLAALMFSGTRNRGVAKRLFRATRSYMTAPPLAFAALVAAASTCDWDFADEIVAQLGREPEPAWSSPGAIPFILLSQPAITPQIQLEAARARGALCRRYCASPCAARRRAAARPVAGRLSLPRLSWPPGRAPLCRSTRGPRSRRGRDHRQRLFAGLGRCDQKTAAGQLRRFVPIQDLSDEEAARRMAEDACDVIVDMTGWVEGHRGQTLAWRPAPVQVQWLGYAGTMAAPWFDHILADSVLIPPGEEADYTEKVIRLPHCYQPTDNTRTIGAARPRSDYGLPEDAFVFCSFNQSYKITRAMFDVWMSLLAEVDGAVLWLLTMDRDAQDALRRRASEQGIAPDRVIFAPMLPSEEHLARLSRTDLALDCFPYGSHTTASDLMYAGVPLVAFAGDTFASRVSASILSAAGLPDLVTRSRDEFRGLALQLARDRTALAAMGARVARSRRSPLFDTVGFAGDLEAAWCQSYERYRAGFSPDRFAIG